ncbi:MAG: hypothetical protein K2Y40_19405 [Reyranella sp.]|nr:hypothetical protein [Reyranella sp.]
MRKKFTTRVDAGTLAAMRDLAKAEGRQLQELLDEALTDLIEKRRLGRPRAHVVEVYRRSHARYAELYKKLAQ